MEVFGYQTLEDKDNIDEIELDGPFKCTRPDAWLGDGCYLWDSNMEWAKQWGKNVYQHHGKDFVIGRCSLLIDESCFDLFGNVSHQMEFKKLIEILVEHQFIEKERITVPVLIEYLKRKGIFEFKSIRAADFQGSPDKLAFRLKNIRGKWIVREHMLLNQRVQICVIHKKNVILPPFLVVYPEKYLI